MASITRDNGKPNSKRMHAGRVTLAAQSTVCATCCLPVQWLTKAADAEKTPSQATFGHVVSEADGGTWSGNTVVQCWSCNWAAGTRDLTGDVAFPPLAWVPASVAAVTADPRSDVFTPDMPGAQARKDARKARGLTW